MNYNRRYPSKYYDVLKWESRLTSELDAAKITDYIKKFSK